MKKPDEYVTVDMLDDAIGAVSLALTETIRSVESKIDGFNRQSVIAAIKNAAQCVQPNSRNGQMKKDILLSIAQQLESRTNPPV